jgi:RNA polymerase sigma-70 factor (ECF subfamily)
MDAQTKTIENCADDELVARAQGHDDSAFEELMRRTAPASLKLAESILRDRQEAEDQVQNSYMNAWRHVNQFQREAKFSTWITRIVVNQCLMRLRKLRKANFVSLVTEGPEGEIRVVEVKDQGQSPEESLSGKELSQALEHEIARLPPLLRGVLILRDVDQLSTADVARQLGVSPSAVKSRLLRARVELRTRLEKYRTQAELITHTA